MRTPSPLDALMPRVRQRILAATLLDPGRRWSLGELAQHLGLTPSTLQREVRSLAEVGILTVVQDVRRTCYEANPSSPILSELQGLMRKTLGVGDALRTALQPFEEGIVTAFVYGSELDLIVVGEVEFTALAGALAPLEGELDQEVGLTVYTPAEFAERVVKGDPFLTSAMGSVTLSIVGEA